MTAVPEPFTYDVAVIGAGYVGLPLSVTFAEAGSKVLIVDVQTRLVDAINNGVSHIEDVTSDRLKTLVDDGLIAATGDYGDVRDAYAILIALPTPLSRQREPDLSYVERAATSLAPILQRGQVVVLESTTWPGTTREIVQPILEHGSGLTAGKDFHLAMSPERVDPGREDWTTKTTPKVVGGINKESTEAAAAVYRRAVDTVHELSTPEAAELTKLLENIYRAVNIALVNELAQLCDRMDIDVWEVVEAAATKPFGFAPVHARPGPRRPLHPDRPVLPHLEGARVRLLDALHRARRRGQQQHAVLLPLADLAGAEPRRAEVASAARASSFSASPTSRISATGARRRRRSSSTCSAARAPRSHTTTRTCRPSTG